MTGGIAALSWVDDTDWRRDTQDRLDATVREALGADPGVSVELEVREGNPAQQLIDASRGADLLVVGTRGHGGFAGMLLGSVSQHLAAHATCPVTVIR